jgi:hypothetical protein
VLKQQELNMSSKSPRPPVGGGQGGDNAADQQRNGKCTTDCAGGQGPTYSRPPTVAELLSEQTLARAYALFKEAGADGLTFPEAIDRLYAGLGAECLSS